MMQGLCYFLICGDICNAYIVPQWALVEIFMINSSTGFLTKQGNL